MNPLASGAALLAGLAVTLAFWAGRDALTRRFIADQQWMRETRLRFHPEPINAQVWVLLYYGGFLGFLVVMLAVIPSVPAVVVIWIAALFLTKPFISWRWKKRLEKIDAQIPATVATLANSMRAGLTLVQAITRLSEQAPEPIRMEFKIMANQYGYGADMDTVIRNAKARLGLPNFTLFASALLLNREMGGDISETLTRISKSLDKLREMKKTVEAHTSEGRTNIRVLLIAPLVMLAMMSVVTPKGVGLLFSTVQGWAILGIAAILSGTGVYVASRITRSEI
ncbi:MAG TPA: type II secretion system F family protein [Phycisphaerae bacterium]|jgi:tight adherence protein B